MLTKQDYQRLLTIYQDHYNKTKPKSQSDASTSKMSKAGEPPASKEYMLQHNRIFNELFKKAYHI